MRTPKRYTPRAIASAKHPSPHFAPAYTVPAACAAIDENEAVPAIVTKAYAAANNGMRMRVLSRLLRSVGPLALAVVAGGAFARYVTQARWPALTVSLSDAAHVTSSQVYELAAYVQQSNPDVARQILGVLARDGTTMTALGATVGALLIGYLSGDRRRSDRLLESSNRR